MQDWYQSVAPLDLDQHAGLKLVRQPDFRFASSQVSLPLCIEELAPASAFFPIVFGIGEKVIPLAVTGLSAGENLFVDEAGAWARDVYIPAVVRNYPFVVLEAGEGREFVGVDTQSNLLSLERGEPLFENGAPTPLCQQRAGLCRAYRDSMRTALAFGQALRDAGCLDAKHAQIALPGGEPSRLEGFAAVNVAALDKVADETFLQWRRQGWLAPLVHHLASIGQWQRLLNLKAARRESEQAAVSARPVPLKVRRSVQTRSSKARGVAGAGREGAKAL